MVAGSRGPTTGRCGRHRCRSPRRAPAPESATDRPAPQVLGRDVGQELAGIDVDGWPPVGHDGDAHLDEALAEGCDLAHPVGEIASS